MAGADWNELQLLVGRISCVSVPACTGHSPSCFGTDVLFHSPVLLTLHRESYGDHGAVHQFVPKVTQRWWNRKGLFLFQLSMLFLLLRRTKVSTLRSSFFLSFMCSVNCILGIPRFWINIHLPVSAYLVCSSVIGLCHS